MSGPEDQYLSVNDDFDDDSFLDDDDMADFNLGYQAGVMTERERILKAIQEADSACGVWAEAVILKDV